MIIIGKITTPIYKFDMSKQYNEYYSMIELLLIVILNPFS